MRSFLRAASMAASTLCAFGIVAVAVPSLAAETSTPTGSATAMLAAVTAPLLSVDVNSLQHRDQDVITGSQPTGSDQTADIAILSQPQTLQDMVAAHEDASTGDEQGDCLATSVYFEAKGEPLDGQLAVAQTVMNRATSGRFPDSVCGVVRQPGQFSFLHHGALPSTPHESDAWRRAVAIARIARDGLWKQIAPAALFFHARRVSPGWGKIRVASLGNHVFFR